MNDVANIQLWQFSLIYVLLLIVLFIMKKCKIQQSKLLVIASVRMTVQLIIAGLVLTYIFKNPHPLFTITYIIIMLVFTIQRILSKNKNINKQFKYAIAWAMIFSSLPIIIFFVCIVIGESIFNPQYMITISGMILGNAMTGVSLGINTFNTTFHEQRGKMEVLLNMGATPKNILEPLVNYSLETALLPTLNSMLGMGIVALPGMMTGQILSGTLPSTAILYQISIMIAICTVVCLSVFLSLYWGHKSLYNDRNQIKYN